MKPLFILTVLLMAVVTYGEDKKISDLPNTGTLQSTDLLLLERPNDHNYNITGSQLSSAYDAAGAATAATNGLGGSAFKGTNAFDLAGTAIAVTNGFPWGVLYDPIGRAVSVTNGYPWGVLYDAAGAATVATNGYPWGALYQPAGALTNFDTRSWSNSSASGVTITNLADGSNTNLVYSDKNGRLHRGAIGSGLNWNAATETLSASGGGGSQTPWAQDINAGTFNLTNGGYFSFTGNSTNGGNLKNGGNLTNAGTASFTGNVTNFADTYHNGATVFAGGVTNSTLTASTLLEADANKKIVSIPNGVGALTNDASGHFGFAPLLDASALGASAHVKTGATTNLISSEDGSGYTNLVSWTHEGTTTNITATFNGTLQTFTCTNGPSIGQNYFIHYAGANGSISYRFAGSSYNNLTFDYQPKWLAGSNSVITNGVLTLTSYGGTNATQIEAAIRENQ